ncbi:phytoene desaturase family protein [Rothia santali]|uniref:phytoene desaturase family protein n=1 Tax=Rothia santali TaxID=2949643 RepID=UPI0028150EDF|nr:NAD(P)/FAD-dependent oxidoreductase [Rothia santali]
MAAPRAPLAHPLPGRPAALLRRDAEATARGLGPDGRAWRSVHTPLLGSPAAVPRNVMGPLLRWPRDPAVMARFGARAVWSASALARACFRGDEARALFTGSALHAVMPPSHPLTAAFGTVFGALGMTSGWPVARGGSQAIVDALVRVLTEAGGRIRCGVEVADLRDLPAHDVAVLDVVPSGLLALGGTDLPEGYARRLRRWRHGPAVHKVDFLLDGPVPWADPRVGTAGTVHVGGGPEELGAAEDAVRRGSLPQRPFVMVTQQQAADPSRCALPGRHVLWTYAHVPHGCSRDVRPLIEAQIERFAPGFRDRVLTARDEPPAALERWNPNLVGGDIGGGSLGGLQQVFRPTPSLQPYRAGRRGLYLCSSSTPPGGGAHGMGGWNAAGVALRDLGA